MKLSHLARMGLPRESFAIPEERKYPIEDIAHARNALSRVAQFGNANEQQAVRSKVKSMWGDAIQSLDKKAGV